MKFFKNPPGRRKRKKRRSAAQVAATRKLVALNKKKRKPSVKRRKVRRAVARKRRINTNKGAGMAKRRRKSTRSRARKSSVRRRAAVRRGRKGRRRSSGSITLRRITGKVYRSNPGIVGQVVQGAKDAGLVLAGGAATRAVSNVVPLDKTGMMGTAVQLASALAVGMVARRFLGADAARFVIAGGMQVPVKSLVTTMVPAAAPLLGDYDMLLSYPGVSSYPALAGDGDGMASYTEDGIASYAE